MQSVTLMKRICNVGLRRFSLSSCVRARGTRFGYQPPRESFDTCATFDNTQKLDSKFPKLEETINHYADGHLDQERRKQEAHFEDVRYPTNERETKESKKSNKITKESKSPKQSEDEAKGADEMVPEVIRGHPSTIPNYEKLEPNDASFGNLMMLLKSKKQLEKQQKIILEGQRLIQDALDAGMEPSNIYFSRVQSIQELRIPVNCFPQFSKIAYKKIQLWSDLTTSPGLIGIFKCPKLEDLTGLEATNPSQLPLTLVCDNIRDPGNLGSVLRVAAGAGCKQILLSKGCVNVWDTKVLRSGAGAHFRVPLVRNFNWADLDILVHQQKATVYLADSRFDLQKEGEVQDYAGVKVPANFPCVLVLGGETHGLSLEAKGLFARSGYGCRIHVPLAAGVESLNVTAALAVILFELRRQLVQGKPSEFVFQGGHQNVAECQ